MAGLTAYDANVVRYDRNNVDPTDDLFFYRDLSRFYNMTYDAQITSILLLNTELAGVGNPWANDWRLANGADLAELRAGGGGWIDVLSVFNPGGSTILKGRTNVPAPPDPAHVVWEVYSSDSPPFSQEQYAKDDADMFPTIGAWAVASYEEKPLPITVEIDIKPGNDANCFNINGHGVIPVAILGSDTFDVTLVDQTALLFGGLEVRVRGNKGPQCHFEDSSADGILDLVCQFEDNSDYWTPGDGEATLTGKLQDETEFMGTDSICVVP